MYQALGTRSKDFDSEGNFELHQCRILDPLLFAMHLDEMNVIIAIYERFDVSSNFEVLFSVLEGPGVSPTTRKHRNSSSPPARDLSRTPQV
jgi:hypothetical protein